MEYRVRHPSPGKAFSFSRRNVMNLPPQAATVVRQAHRSAAFPRTAAESRSPHAGVAPSSSCNPPGWYYCYCPASQVYECCPSDLGCSDGGLANQPCLCSSD